MVIAVTRKVDIGRWPAIVRAFGSPTNWLKVRFARIGSCSDHYLSVGRCESWAVAAGIDVSAAATIC